MTILKKDFFRAILSYVAMARTLINEIVFRIRMNTTGSKYVKEVCDYLHIDKKGFLEMTRRACLLDRDFYNDDCYIPFLVRGNRIWHNRDRTWMEIVQIINRFDNPSVLEFGCGAGCLTQYLFEKDGRFLSYAYDIPSKTLGFAKWRLPNTKFLDGIVETDVFDIVIVLSVLEHLKPDECRKTAELLEKITKKVLIINFVAGSSVGHVKETQEILPQIERFFDARFKKKTTLWAPDLFAYER